MTRAAPFARGAFLFIASWRFRHFADESRAGLVPGFRLPLARRAPGIGSPITTPALRWPPARAVACARKAACGAHTRWSRCRRRRSGEMKRANRSSNLSCLRVSCQPPSGRLLSNPRCPTEIPAGSPGARRCGPDRGSTAGHDRRSSRAQGLVRAWKDAVRTFRGHAATLQFRTPETLKPRQAGLQKTILNQLLVWWAVLGSNQ